MSPFSVIIGSLLVYLTVKGRLPVYRQMLTTGKLTATVEKAAADVKGG